MFIFDFVAETVLDQIIDWLYGKIVGFLNDFFAMMNNMGVELFDLPWVNAITTFFSWLGWALFVVGLVVGAFECAIEYQGGRGSIKDTALNYVKGFMAVSLFSILPVNLYSLSVSLQSSFGSALSGITDAESIGMTAQQVLMSAAMPGVGNPILQIFCAVMMGYAVIKVFFGNLKRGGILLIQIAVGSLYMFSVPRGYIDGFTQWCKQVIGICLTAFLQSTMLTAGLMIFKDHPLLGLGVMLSSTEVPRIAGQFGLDTSTKANLMSGVYAAQTAINISKTVVKAVAGMAGNNQPILFDNHGPDTRYSGPVKVAQTITSALGTGGNNTPLAVHGEPYCIAGNVINRQDKNGGNGCGYQQGVSYTLTTEDRHCVAYTDDLQRKKRVRKLIPLECERLMGFPDHWTDIPGASDSVRYRALGNSVAVPCVEYILCGIAYFLERQEGERDVHIPG